MGSGFDRGQKIVTDGGVDQEKLEQIVKEYARQNTSQETTEEEENPSNEQKATAIGHYVENVLGRLKKQNQELKKESARDLAESQRQRGEKIGTRRGFLYGAGAAAGAGILGAAGLAAINQSEQRTGPLPQETESVTFGEESDNSAEQLITLTEYIESNFDEDLPYSGDELRHDYGIIDNNTGKHATRSTVKYNQGGDSEDSVFIHRFEYSDGTSSAQKPRISDGAARLFVGFDDYEGEADDYVDEIEGALEDR